VNQVILLALATLQLGIAPIISSTAAKFPPPAEITAE
jgi:hypothetical protein